MPQTPFHLFFFHLSLYSLYILYLFIYISYMYFCVCIWYLIKVVKTTVLLAKTMIFGALNT